jgi:hypothetical protein
VNDTSYCNILKNSPKVQLLKQTVAIIWDEVPMQHRYCMEAVDLNMEDILGNNSPFGGIVVLWGGDFMQILSMFQWLRKATEKILWILCMPASLW